MATHIEQALYLVIDDFAAFRQSVKHMLLKIDVPHENILQASSAEEGWKYIALRNIDVVLCDYNLGSGMNGQQLLEKLTLEHRLRPDMLFIMFTAETSPRTVLAVIEYEPSAYLSKPFSREQLEQRLKRLFAKNQALAEVHKAIRAGELDKALHACDAVKRQHPKYRLSALKIKAQLLEEMGRLDQAIATAKEALSIQDVVWAHLLIGKVFYIRGQYPEALGIFTELSQKNPKLATILDWVALCQEAIGDIPKALETLKKAVHISPLNARRQLKLAYLLEKSGKYDEALSVYSSAMCENLHSCNLRPVHFQHYFDVARREISEQGATEIPESAIVIYKKCEEKYKDTPIPLAANQIAVARLFAQTGAVGETGKFLRRAKHSLLRVHEKVPTPDLQYMRQTLTKLAEAGEFAQQISELQELLNELEKNTFESDGNKPAAELKAAEKCAKGDRLAEVNPLDALECYSEAFWLAPNHEEYKIKAIKTIVTSPTLKSDPVYHAMARDILRIINKERLSPVEKQMYERFVNELTKK